MDVQYLILGRTRHYFRVAEELAVAVRLLGRKLEADQRLDEKKDLCSLQLHAGGRPGRDQVVTSVLGWSNVM